MKWDTTGMSPLSSLTFGVFITLFSLQHVFAFRTLWLGMKGTQKDSTPMRKVKFIKRANDRVTQSSQQNARARGSAFGRATKYASCVCLLKSDRSLPLIFIKFCLLSLWELFVFLVCE